ncbi:helix-turn-helix domain-containing protein [Ascidiimonas sp. W6]|uniref:helix-turn-helix domain-containing protein n=1 Tax=Ascidiimonas meishanensis TaxID=3128903 RepID=UPI0030EF0CF9
MLLIKGINQNRQESKWLALFLFLCSLYICPFMLGYAGWYSIKSYREFLFFVPFQQLLLIGPVIYLYTQSLLNSEFKLPRKAVIHFMPAVFYLLYSLVVFIADKWILEEFYFYADGKDKDLDFWYQMAGLISMLFYLGLSLRYYWNYRKVSNQEVSYADEISYKWVERFMLAFGLILVLRVLFFILNPEWGEFGSKYWYYLCFSILFLYIAFTGYTHSVSNPIKFPFNQILNRQEPAKFESNATINEDDIVKDELWSVKIISLFDEHKVYSDPTLTLTAVALRLNTNRNVVSNVINQRFKMNFNDFVNNKRVEAVTRKLEQGDHIKKTMLGISIECGFNSKTTFNRAFKKFTKMTPKQYISKNNL